MNDWHLFAIIGIGGGLLAGLFGIGGGIILIPALVVWAGFSQHQAVGTSLAVLLPPIGLGATLEYYRHGNVNLAAAAILALTMFVGSWLGAYAANKLAGEHLRLAFGVFVCGVGGYFVYDSVRKLGWL